MFVKQAIIKVAVHSDIIYEYLRNRYDSYFHKTASMASKGYVPKIKCVKDDGKESLEFYVRGRDSILKINIGNWTWGYDLKPISSGETQVTIWYSYGFLSALLSAGTIGSQAANEITETAMALGALANS